MAGPHDRIITDAAKAMLRPLGFQRKGRSRLWFADHSWWIAVVEFQPSSWSRGSYLNVAAHCLWVDTNAISFDYGGRLDGFEEYSSDEQFAASAARLAARAAEEAQRITTLFSSLSGAAHVLLTDARTRARQASGHPGWTNYNAGVAAGLIGRIDDAKEMFGTVLDGPADRASVLHRAAESMSKLVPDPAQFKREVISVIEHQRDALELPPLDRSPF